MSFYDFAKQLYCKTLDDGEIARMGSFSLLVSNELKYMRVLLFINGDIAGTERLRLKIFSDPLHTSLMYTSEWSSLSDISNIGTYWLGWLRITFNRESLNKNLTYYLSAEVDGYTRVGGSFYIGLMFDFPWPIYDNNEDIFYDHPLAMQLFGYL